MSYTDTDIIILAAGSGARFGTPLPKQFCLLAARPVLMHTIDNLRRAAPGARLTLVLSADMHGYWHGLCSEHRFESPETVHGGASRYESTAKALAALDGSRSIVMVHDGARPFADAAILAALHKAVCDGADGAVPAIAVTDSLRRCSGQGRWQPVDRSQYRAMQTPQAFPLAVLKAAFDATRDWPGALTDDASVAEAAGYTHIVLTTGSAANIKITNPIDLALAEAIAASK